MPRVKVARKSTAIDMTAMCDVAFLLLTFFILSAKPKTEDPVRADVPASTAIVPVKDVNLTTIIIGQGKCFFSIEGGDVRIQTLKQMGEKYKVAFSPEELKTFSNLNSFGVSMSQMKQFLDMPADQRQHLTQPGIQVDTTATNELFDWVRNARIADKYLFNKEMTIAIKGDAKEEYPTIKTVIATLQKQKVDRFSLITALKTVKK
jgi:biopolymer transport protein ExbD